MADRQGRRLVDAVGLGQAKEMPLSDWRTTWPRARGPGAKSSTPPTGCATIAVSRNPCGTRLVSPWRREEAAIVSARPAEQFTGGGAVHGWEEKPFSKGSAGKRQPTGGAGWRG